MRALVIDDSKAIRMILSRQLRDLGFEVESAGDGKEALEKMHPDVRLALVDWNMPVMNGFEFVQAVRADPKYAETQLVMVTTETEIDQVVKALTAGANEYVMKPFTKDVIQEKLNLLGLAA